MIKKSGHGQGTHATLGVLSADIYREPIDVFVSGFRKMVPYPLAHEGSFNHYNSITLR